MWKSLLFILIAILLACISYSDIQAGEIKNTPSPYVYEEVFDAITGKVLHNYKSNKETTIKSAVDNLSIASGTNIIVGVEESKNGKVIDSLELQLQIVRSQLFSATKGSEVLKITPRELIKLKPFIPITVILIGTEKLKSIIQNELNQKKTLEEAIAAKDLSGFPAVLNIENYRLKIYFQMTEGRKEEKNQ